MPAQRVSAASSPLRFAGRRICMLTYVFSPKTIPPLYNAARSLVKAGAEVDIVCMSLDPAAPRRESAKEGFHIRWMRHRSLAFFSRKFGLSPRHTLHAAVQYVATYVEYLFRCVRLGVQARADLYEAHDLPSLLPAAVVSRIAKRPLVYYAHELFPEMQKTVRFAGLWRLIEKVCIRGAEVVVTPEENRSEIYRREFSVHKPVLTVLNCPPFREHVRTSVLRDELRARGISASTIVLYQGLLADARCMRELLEASRHFDEGVRLVVMGTGYNEWADPQALFPHLSNVTFLPRVPYDEVFAYTSSADIGVLLYRNDCRNNFYCAPNKLYEYAAAGLPVIAPRFPGIDKTLLSEQFGLTVDPESPEEIARAINRLASDAALREVFGQNALRLARARYSWEKEFETIADAYASLMKR